MQQIQVKGLYGLFYKRIREIRFMSNKGIIPFRVVFQKLCSCFSIPKKECWEVLFIIRDMGLIEIVPYHGIRVR